MAKFEAVLFLSQHPLTSRRLAQLTGLADGTKARTLIRNLNRIYDAEGRSFRVEDVAGGYQLMTRPKFARWLRRLHSAPVEIRLSGPAMETLAVVAYRQPVLRAEIEAIRGVQSGEVLRQLIERDLVRIAGRSNELGRPFLYGTTKQFLQTFGLRHLDELPRSDVLRPTGAAAAVDRDPVDCPNNPNQPNRIPVVEEETNVRTLTMTKTKQKLCTEECAAEIRKPLSNCPGDLVGFALDEDEEDADDEEDDEDDEDLDDEPWEEVDDDDEEEEDDDDEDWDDEDDWDDDEEEWDDDDDEWDDDDDEDEDEEEGEEDV